MKHEAMNEEVEPLPFVPAIWIEEKARSGLPAARTSVRTFRNPSFIPRYWRAYRNESVEWYVDIMGACEDVEREY